MLPQIRRLGGREAVRFYNGFRTWKISYAQLYGRTGAFVRYLDREGFRKGDRLLLWGENRPEWLAVFWGCLARGVEVAPVDFRSSAQLVRRIQGEVHARLLVTGDSVAAQDLKIPQISFGQIEAFAPTDQFEISDVSPADVVEIVYTSGTTGEPMGVVHRHKNICANLTPIQREIDKHKKLARPFQPVRILDMLPLSHLFGQSLGLFIPPLLEGAVVFMLELHAGAILETIRRERVSVLVSVPRLLKNLQNEIERQFDLPAQKPHRPGIPGILQRWWRYRRVHTGLGFKFWALIVGGAEVHAETEAFWSRLGFLVIQGYGLTETSPVVALNHPFNARRGSIGKPIEGQEVKLAPDGEILVRGASVITEYLGPGAEAQGRLENGWLHTGDIGEIDGEGRLYYKGRKKEVIVTSEGLNVYPQDVEAALNALAEVKESAVIALHREDEEQVHAVLILRDASADPESLVALANRRLEPHQRIRGWSIWPEEQLPRTPSTLKVKRGEVARRIAQGQVRREPPEAGGVEGILARIAGRAVAQRDLRLDEDLGISSLERVELLSQLENQYGVELDESRFAQLSTVGELKAWISAAAEQPGKTCAAGPTLPRWTRTGPMRWARFLALQGLILPAFRLFVKFRVEGVENLEGIEAPVIFASNHQSHLDTPAIFAALPLRWRYRVAPAMSQDFFRAWFDPRGFPFSERLIRMLQYYLFCGLFNAFPLPQRMAGVRQALKYTGELIEERYCPLIFPEGKRSPDGKLQPFKTGVGLMAVRLRAPVAPIHLAGLFEIYSIHHEWPQPGEVRVRIGPPLRFTEGLSEEEATRAVEEAIAGLAAD